MPSLLVKYVFDFISRSFALTGMLQDFMIVFRHLLGTPYRTVLLPQIDKLLDESILLGPGVGSRETLRSVI